jgi:hypothetical protein
MEANGQKRLVVAASVVGVGLPTLARVFPDFGTATAVVDVVEVVSRDFRFLFGV